MTYVLRFLPIIEEDALAGYTWYEEKARAESRDAENSRRDLLCEFARLPAMHMPLEYHWFLSHPALFEPSGRIRVQTA